MTEDKTNTKATITEKTLISEALAAYPELAETLGDVGLAGSEKRFGEELRARNIDPETCLALLNRKVIREPADLTYYIMKAHHYTESDQLDEIDPLLQKILKVHYESHGSELAEVYGVFLEAKAALKHHFARQERLFFPAFEEGNLALAMQEAEAEANRELARIMERLADVTDQYQTPQDGCATYQLTFGKLRDLALDVEKHLAIEDSRLIGRK